MKNREPSRTKFLNVMNTSQQERCVMFIAKMMTEVSTTEDIDECDETIRKYMTAALVDLMFEITNRD